MAIAILPFSQEKPQTFNTVLCDGVSVSGLTGFAELRAVVAELQRQHPDARILTSLDNVGQADYTSGHTVDKSGLDDTAGHDLSGLEAVCFEGGEHLGHLSTPAEFPIRLANLLTASRPFDPASFAGGLPWLSGGDGTDIVNANRAPDAALRLTLDRQAIVQIVPVTRAADALAAFPNGYFVNDLQPAENHALAGHLEAHYGLALFGVGAEFLAFRRGQPCDAPLALAVATELVALYDEAPFASVNELAAVLTGRDWVLVRYTGG